MDLETSSATPAPTEEPAAVGAQGKAIKAAKKRELDQAAEQAKEAKRRKMQEKRFLRLYRSLRRMNHVEAKRRDLLEAGGDPNEGVVNGVLYRKVKRSVIDNINATPDGTNDEQQQQQVTNRQQQSNNDEAGQDDDEEERFWVDRYGWPLEEDVYMGTDIVGEWDAWRDEHQRREDQLESARRAAAAATSSSSSTSTSSTAESASAIFAPRHFGNGHRRGSVRGENGFGGGWNDDHCGGGLAASSVSFDNISDDDSDDDDDANDDGHGRRARFGARSLSLDAVGCASARGGGGGVDSGDEGHTYARSDSSRPRFMSRHAAKMRKRYPMLAEWRASSMSYEDKRQLMRDITLLDADHVPELLKIIFRQMPDSFATRQMLAQTIDMDVSFLSPATLSRVEDYVYTVLGKRHGQQQLQQQQRRRSASVSLNSSSSRAGSPPHTPLSASGSSLRRRRATSSVVSIQQHGSDDDSWLNDGDDVDINVDVDSNDGFNHNSLSHSSTGHAAKDAADRHRPRRDSVLSASAPVTTTAHRSSTVAGKGKAKGGGRTRGSSGKARKTERSTSPRGEEARGRRRSASTDGAAADEVDTNQTITTTPAIVISTPTEEGATTTTTSSSPAGIAASGDDVAAPPASVTSPPGRRGSSSGGRTPRKRKNSSTSPAKAPSPPGAAAAAAVGTATSPGDSLVLPPKQPKQASPTVRPRRTRKVRMFDPHGDKAAPLPKPLHACLEILQELMAHEYGWVFNTPVDPLALNIPDYFDVIKNPMDLGTIKTQLQSGHYETPEEFAADVRLVWNNALTYNEQDNEVHLLAKEFQAAFEQSYASVQAEWDRHKQLHPTPARAAATTTKNAADVAAATTSTTPTQVIEGGETKTEEEKEKEKDAMEEEEANTTTTMSTPTTTAPPLEVVETVETKTEPEEKQEEEEGIKQELPAEEEKTKV